MNSEFYYNYKEINNMHYNTLTETFQSDPDDEPPFPGVIILSLVIILLFYWYLKTHL